MDPSSAPPLIRTSTGDAARTRRTWGRAHRRRPGPGRGRGPIEAAREVARGQLEELAGGPTGTLRLACFPSAIRGVAAPVLGALGAAAPKLRIHLRELAPEPGVGAVAGGYADEALVHDWVHDRSSLPAGLQTVHLGEDPVDLVVPAAHPLAERPSVDLAETVNDVWVTDVSDSTCTRWIIDMLNGATDTPRVYFRAEEYASQVELVAAGLCVGVLPGLGRPALPDTARVVPLRGEVPTRRFVAVYRKPTSRRPAFKRLIQALKDEIRPESGGTEATRGRPLHPPG